MQNAHDLSEIGAHPRRWLELLTIWEKNHVHYALPKSGKPGDPPYCGRDFVVIVIDAHNVFEMENYYTGLQYLSSRAEPYSRSTAHP